MAHIGFDRLEGELERKGKSRGSAKRIAAAIGRKKYGRKGMARLAAKGRKKHGRKKHSRHRRGR